MIGVFFFWGVGGGGGGDGKRLMHYFTSRLPLPKSEVSVCICVIVSYFTGNSSGLQQRRLLSKCIYVLSRFPGKR